MVSTHLKNISKNENLPQIGVKINNIWNHHLDLHIHIHWVWPRPSNSDHQDYYIFSRESRTKPLFATGILGRGHTQHIHEGCSKFFHLENVIFAKKIYFRPTFANSMFFFRGTCWPRFLRKTWMCDILKLFQASDPSSHFILRQLHLNIYVLL